MTEEEGMEEDSRDGFLISDESYRNDPDINTEAESLISAT